MRTKMTLILSAIVVFNLVSWKAPMGHAYNTGQVSNYKCQATSCGTKQCFYAAMAMNNVCCASDSTKGKFCVYTGNANDYCTLATSVIRCKHCEIVGASCPTMCPANEESDPINIDRCIF